MKKYITLVILGLILSVTSIAASEADSTVIQATKSIVDSVTEQSKDLGDYVSVPKIIVSILLLVATFFFLKFISLLLTIWSERNAKNRITIKGIIPIIRVFVWIGALSFILVAVFHPPMASILAFTASIGVAIGFAAQDLLKNIFGGIVIIFDKPFQIGDKVEIGNHYGEVIGIGLRSTRLVTPDDNEVSVPNAEAMNSAVSNANSGEENCQVSTEIYMPLSSNISEIKKSGIEAAQTSRYVYLNKPIIALVNQKVIGNKVVLQLKVKAYVNDIRNEFLLKSDITEALTIKYKEIYTSLNEGTVDF